MLINRVDSMWGYNMGESSGASIPHLHLHVVPRYPRELGFMDVIGGARIIIEDPNVTQEKLHKIFQEFSVNTQDK